MKKLILILILFHSAIVYSQKNVEIMKNNKGIVKSVRIPYENEKSKLSVNAFLMEYLQISSSDTFIKVPQKQRSKKYLHEHYDQYYKGVKLEGGGYNFHFKNGRLFLADGNFVKIESLDFNPKISVEEAKNIFVNYKNIPGDKITDFKSDLIIKELSIKDNDSTSAPYLLYKVYLTANHHNNNEIGYVNANDGTVVFTEPNAIGSVAIGTFETRYNGTKQAQTQYYGNGYNLCDSTRDAIIHTWNLDGSTDFNDKEELTDINNYWAASEYHSNKDDMGLDIHWALQKIYDHFYNEYDIKSFNNGTYSGVPINAYIHHGTSYNDKDNSAWSPTQHLLYFGDGAIMFDAMASLDIVAHEYGHGIADYQIGWGSTGNELVLQEGIADIWAVILEHRINPNSIWKYGEQVDLSYDCIRNIQDPDDPNARFELADTYVGPTYNSGDEHVKSGVFSHWFYLLVNGGTGTTELGYDYTVYGIGIDAAEDLLVQAVFENYLDNKNNLNDVRTGTVNAAEDDAIFGTNSFHALQVENAWWAVGITPMPIQPTISGNSVVCRGGTVFTANNAPSGSSISWSTSSNLEVYENGTTTTPTIRATSSSISGEGWVQANYTSNGYTASGPRKTVWVGIPGPIDVYDDPTYFLCNHMNIVFVDYGNYTYYDMGVNQVVWSYQGATLSNINDGFTKAYITAGSSSGTGYIYVDVSNTCPGSSGDRAYYEIECFHMVLTIAPNPANGETTVSIVEEGEDSGLKSASLERPFDTNTEWDLEVYDSNQNLKAKKIKLKGNSTKLQTSGWKEGVYIVRAKYNDEILTDKLVVKK